jgi:ABC-type nitrate/sulfonate/bicarbonate transport system substrate-binding protein
LTTTERLIEEQPEIAAGAVRAVVKAQAALKADPSRATAIAERLFPAEEVPLIAGLIERDAPYYDAAISPEAVDGLNKFAQASGLIAEPVAFDRLVATQFRPLWQA